MSERELGVIERVCRIPIDFRRRGDVSSIQLVIDSGYLENSAAVTEAAVRDYLEQHSELIEPWQLWSYDKRSDQGWYLECEELRFEIGYFSYSSTKSGRSNVRRFSNRTAATAAFIVEEVASIAKLARC